jgi:hydroxymethylglutaryl-CoA synthase
VASRRGILSYGAYLPRRRLDRSEITPVAGSGGGRGTRTVASYDEDTTTMAVAAARNCTLSSLNPASASAAAEPGPGPGALWFATTAPAYLDKTNATAVHAALRLHPRLPAFDAAGSVRSAVGALHAGLTGPGRSLVVAADVRGGRPGSADEAAGGDAAAALVVGEEAPDAPLLAELVGGASATAEILDRWRTPGDDWSHVWEERSGEGRYLAAGQQAWDDALRGAGLTADDVDGVVVVGSHARAAATFARKLGLDAKIAPAVAALASSVGFAGAAQPALALAAQLDGARPGQVVALVVLADGADVVLLRTTDALATRRPASSVADQLALGLPVSYGTYLRWRGQLAVEPPRRPEPARPSASASARSVDWKFGFVGSEAEDGTVHLPPEPLDVAARPMADEMGTVVTFTVDKLAYSLSPPVVFAVVDFDGGGRLPVELTDVSPDGVAIGDRVEMTFRRLFTSDGIHNYFWKARPLRRAPSATGEGD